MCHTYRILLFLLSLYMLCVPSESTAQTMHGITGGIGVADIMDTYLSPYSYHGSNLHLQRETQRDAVTFGIEDVRFQTLLDIDASILENPGKNINEYAGGIRYSLGWTKGIWTIDMNKSAVDVHFGPMISGYAGCVYNERNGNNPAQAKVELMIDLTASARWKFHLLKRDMTIGYQVVLPMAGVAFSPNYGQSYYEAFDKGNYDHNVVFANVFNMPSLRHIINLDIPLRKSSQTALRIGYLGYFMQSKFNDLRYHSYTNTFMIGVTKIFKRL